MWRPVHGLLEAGQRRWRRAWARLRPPAPRREAIAAGGIRYPAQPAPFIEVWERYCIGLCRDALRRLRLPLWIDFGAQPADAARPPPRRIELQWEHTLVAPGGRDSEGARPGAIALAGGHGRYLVRVAEAGRLQAADLVFDYSEPNRINLAGAAEWAALAAKTVVVAPAVYPFDPVAARRDLAMISLFADPAQPRRREFLAAARAAGLPLRNLRGVYRHDALRQLYRRTRILLNLHQTDHHHSFEELRVLPALLCGVLVVSETVPLREAIPYHRAVIWAGHGQLIDVLKDVERDYARHWQRIFGDPAVCRLLADLHADNQQRVDAALQRLAAG